MAQQTPNPDAANIHSLSQCPCSLLDLPTELLVQICHWALKDAEKDKKPPYHPDDWLRLGRTCKRFYAVVQPFLYRNIIAGENHTPYEHHRRINLGKLFHRLWANPGLRPLVHHVTLNSATRPEPSSRPRLDLIRGSVDENRTGLSAALKQHLGIDLAEASPPIPSTMAQWCRESAVPLFLLLSMTPNVTSVEMYMHCGWDVDHGLARKLSDGTFVPKLVFPNLASLRIWSHSWAESLMREGCRCRDGIACLLAAAPNLASLELSGFGVLEGGLPLPSRLASFALIDTHYASGSGLEVMARQAPQLKRFYVLRERKGGVGPPPPHLGAELLQPLSRSQVAGTLVTLGLNGSRLEAASSVDLGNFGALKVLGINCATGSWPESNLLINLIKRCNHLRSLVLDGADMIPREEMMRFAHAVSLSECPSLRQVLLNIRDVRYSWRPQLAHLAILRGRAQARLREITKHPVPDLFAAGNVEFFLHDGRNKGMLGWFTEMEAGSALLSIFV
ncbi:hypothetical protein F5144DRAFT_161846 [Chaetomium tenue]|uniref:Uncharacterized protein n=1 Tax=Chaetomium tenue TaxID=1854479 RepID=A0ACB7P9X8_9PEZI|nr:hypothetical protein F5144DRAFT_161846 [Chaetomium globosum]